MTTMKGSEIITEFLIKAEMPYVLGICGHGNVGMLDSLYGVQDQIKLISPRHEQTAGHMADAYFRIRHQPVATLTSCGPGSANIVMSLATALADSSAFLAITANVPTSQFNRGPFQEINMHNQADFPSVIRPVVKHSYQPSRVEMLPLAIRQAMTTMTTGRPGPVQLDVPYNLFQEEANFTATLGPAKSRISLRSGASTDNIDEVVRMIRAAQRPVFFIGHGVTLSEAGPELTKAARRLEIPVISSPNGMGCIPMDDPLSLGFIGRNGAYQANQAGRHADLVITIGARFDDRSSSSWLPGYSWNIPPAKLIHVDIDPKELGRNYPPFLGLVADARTFLRQLMVAFESSAMPTPGRLRAWREQIDAWRKEWQAHVAPNFEIDGAPMRPERVVHDVRKVLSDDAILALDAGVHHNWFMQFWEARQPQTMLNSWGFSSMGFGVSGVLGAKLAAPDRPCVAVVGDGGFTMTPHVLCTAVEYDLPVVWVVWNNFCWAAIRDIQQGLFDGREIGTKFSHGGNQEPYNPDFAAVARAHGVQGVTCRRSSDFQGALETAINDNKPWLIDLHVDADVKPPAIGAWQLPPTPYTEPAFGKRYVPEATD